MAMAMAARDSPHDERAAAIQLLRTRPDETQRILSRLARAVAPPSSSTVDSTTEALDAWVGRWMPHASRSLALRNFERTGRGLAATVAIRQHDVVLRVPLSLVLTARELPRHPILDTWHDDLRLAAALLLETIRRPQGAWAEYLPLLPATPPSALHWSDAQLEQMSGTPLPAEVIALTSVLTYLLSAPRGGDRTYALTCALTYLVNY